MERLATVGMTCKGKPTRQAAWLSQQGCNSAGGLIMLRWSEIIQITPAHTCLDRWHALKHMIKYSELSPCVFLLATWLRSAIIG